MAPPTHTHPCQMEACSEERIGTLLKGILISPWGLPGNGKTWGLQAGLTRAGSEVSRSKYGPDWEQEMSSDPPWGEQEPFPESVVSSAMGIWAVSRPLRPIEGGWVHTVSLARLGHLGDLKCDSNVA